jgi:hypothetical protein
MVSPAALYFAGIGTVLGAIGFGFAGALLVVSAQPVHKEPPSAFAKRDQPIEVVQAATPAQATETTGQPPARTGSFEIMHTTPTKVEEVVGLQFAPPTPQTNDAPVTAPDFPPHRAAPTPVVETPALEPTGSVKTERKMNREYRNSTAAFAEKKQSVRKHYVERKKKQIEGIDRSLLAWLAERAAQ